MWKLPEPGDIVWTIVPFEDSEKAESKVRPCLVFSVTNGNDEMGPQVQVVPSTSKKLDKLFSGDVLIIERLESLAFKKAGLLYDSKFQFGKMVTLPWTADFFKVRQNKRFGDHPKIGALHESMNRAFAAAYMAVKK